MPSAIPVTVVDSERGTPRRSDDDLTHLRLLIERLQGPGSDELIAAFHAFENRYESLVSSQAAALAKSAMMMSDLKNAQQQIEAERERAEAASQAKSRFLANISHEIRTPLNGVVGMNAVLLNTDLNPRQRRCANVIHNSAEALLAVINDVLDLSRIEAGRMEIDPAPFDLRRLVDDVAALHAANAHQKGLELIVDLPPDVPASLVSDGGRLRQILVNLVGNAIKFTHSGEVIVRLARPESLPDGRVRLSFEVEDTGIGIPSEAQDRIFDTFTQSCASTTAEYGGTGLGLAISAELVRLLGGRIEVHSEPGSGATFLFNIVVGVDTSADSTDARANEFAHSRVLVVLGSTTASKITCRQLRHWGCEVTMTTAASALDLLSTARAGPDQFDTAIIDLSLPDDAGLELAASIERAGDLTMCPSILASPLGLDPEDADCRDAAVERCVNKPMAMAELRHAMRTVLGRADGAQDRGPVAADQPPSGRGLILVAEDNPVNQVIATEFLQMAGFDCEVAPDGVAAVEAFAAQRYALVLMDCRMPRLDGLDATRRMRALEGREGRNRTPILALTANALDSDRERCLEAGMDDFLSKPFTERALHDMLDRWVTSTDVDTAGAVPADCRSPNRDDRATLNPAAMDEFAERERNGSSGIVNRLLAGFAQQSDEQMATLHGSIATGDTDTIAFIAHSLKSSSAVIGAERLSSLCQHLESRAPHTDLTDLVPLVDQVTAEYSAVCSALSERYDHADGRSS